MLYQQMERVASRASPTASSKVKNLVRRQFVFGLQNNLARARQLAEFELYDGNASLLRTELDRYLAVTREGRAARRAAGTSPPPTAPSSTCCPAPGRRAPAAPAPAAPAPLRPPPPHRSPASMNRHRPPRRAPRRRLVPGSNTRRRRPPRTRPTATPRATPAADETPHAPWCTPSRPRRGRARRSTSRDPPAPPAQRARAQCGRVPHAPRWSTSGSRCGRASSTRQPPGLASITGDMLKEGTRTKTSAQIAEAIEFVGGSLEVLTGPDTTTFSRCRC